MSRPPSGLPPRHSLPSGMVVPVLPGLGLAWYDRTGGYWARRAALSLVWVIGTAASALITIGILGAAHSRSAATFAALLAIEVVYSVSVVSYVTIRTVRRWNLPRSGGPGRPGRSGAGGESEAGAVHVLEQIFIAFSCLTVGLYLSMLLASLLPETLVERQARLALAAELRERGHTAPEP